MSDEEQSGKRRKSLEAGRDYVVPEKPKHADPIKRRESLEALCSPSYIAKESAKPTTRRYSVDNCRPEAKTRLSQDLSRDVEKINQELSQLLFSDEPSEDPKGGSMDTRRTRAPQSYYSRTRRIPAGGSSTTDAPSVMPWQTAGESSTSLPWMHAPPPVTSSHSSLSEAPVSWEKGGRTGQAAMASREGRFSLDTVLERTVQSEGGSATTSLHGMSSLSKVSFPGEEDCDMSDAHPKAEAPQSSAAPAEAPAAHQPNPPDPGPSHTRGLAPSATGSPIKSEKPSTPWHRRILRSIKKSSKSSSSSSSSMES
mmetsp:Transcript_34561/g.81927  ORF Transcript_34561/g.81927 Transcript_34561/m.81927 type:complete len:311 (-) Transcript_34561:999-1931(-)